MNDEQLLRYSRHIMLSEIDLSGQEKITNANVLIIGLGGLGSPLAMYLAAAGVGELTVVDPDIVDISNLQRQIIHTSHDLGRKKVDSAYDYLTELNPEIRVNVIDTILANEELTNAVRKADVVADASDNFETRFGLNKVCVATHTPLVSGAAIRFEGQISVFNPADPASPCYNCLYDDNSNPIGEETCADNGVVAPLLGIIGSIQANEVIKLLVGIGNTLQGRLLLLDCLNMEFHQAILNKDPACPVCSGN